jgi:hypothetical protein
MQNQIFVLTVLFGLVMTQPSRADDDVVESVLATEWYRHRDMLVMMLLSHAGNGVAESMLAISHQGTTADRHVLSSTIKVPPPTANIPTSAIRVPPSTVRVPPPTANVSSPTVRVPPPIAKVSSLTVRVPHSIVKVPSPTAKVSSPAVKMSLILQSWGQKRFSLWDVLMVEAIDLDVWMFTPAPRWVPTVMVYDNDLE